MFGNVNWYFYWHTTAKDRNNWLQTIFSCWRYYGSNHFGHHCKKSSWFGFRFTAHVRTAESLRVEKKDGRITHFFLSLSFLRGCESKRVSAATFLLLKAFISSSSSRLFSSTFLFSSWCMRFSCSNFSCNWGETHKWVLFLRVMAEALFEPALFPHWLASGQAGQLCGMSLVLLKVHWSVLKHAALFKCVDIISAETGRWVQQIRPFKKKNPANSVLFTSQLSKATFDILWQPQSNSFPH